MNPRDTNVLLALGVLSFIQRNFKSASQFFQIALKENPTDHSLWNKFGAALANNLQPDLAIEAY